MTLSEFDNSGIAYITERHHSWTHGTVFRRHGEVPQYMNHLVLFILFLNKLILTQMDWIVYIIVYNIEY